MELYMVCVLIAIALSMVIFKGLQLVLSIVHPLPNEADLQWKKHPQLPTDHPQAVEKKDKKKKKKSKEMKAKRLPRNMRLEQLYSGSPISFDELDTSYGRRSVGSSNRGRVPSRYEDYSNGREPLQQGIPLEQISFVEDEDDPFEAYVQHKHQAMLKEVGHTPNRSSTPIQSYYSAKQSDQYPKGHNTIV